jgi:uncharacterized membrane protein YccF (DUF307 family)
MNKSLLKSVLGGWIVFVAVVVLIIILWFRSTPSQTAVADSSLTPLALDAISKDSIQELDSLVKNGNLPVTVNPADLGRDNPFIAY